MINLHSLGRQIKPAGIYAFFDKIQVWLKQPLSPAQINWVRCQCGTGGLHVRNRTASFDHRYRQRLQLYQPNGQVLKWLAKRNEVHLNFAEFSLDWTFNNQSDCDDAWEFICKYQVKKHHRNHGIRFVKGVTRYTGPRNAPNVLAIYYDLPSKASGEIHCVHFDWRINRVAALRRAGYSSVSDLVNVNFHHFWLNRLQLYALVPGKLGRMYWNHQRKTNRRGRWLVRCKNGFEYDADVRTGGLIIRALGSTQAVLDGYGKKFDVRRCLSAIDDSHLLPNPHDIL